MSYLVTGGTGFIGRHLVARLLERGKPVHVVARTPVDAGLQSLPGAAENLRLLTGDLGLPRLGLTDAALDSLHGEVEHCFHLAALYDLDADPGRLQEVNVEGTRRTLALAAELGAGSFHHVSSIAVAGSHEGTFTEAMLDEGQPLPHAYHRTKFEAERMVRASANPWRIYRPGVVVGHSATGVTDKLDGPYGVFKAIQKLRGALPQWFPLVGPELGHTNIVPVDFVADAIDFLAHRPGLDRRAFHLVAPQPQRVADVLNSLADAAHAPRLAMRIDPALVGGARPARAAGALLRSAGLAGIRRQILGDLHIPESLLPHVVLRPRFDAEATVRELEGSGIAVPDFEDYAWRLWDHWERHLDPDLAVEDRLAQRVRDRMVVITGASSGIGRATALRLAGVGATTILIARSVERLEGVRAEIERMGATAIVEPCDLSDLAAIDDLLERLHRHGDVDLLVNNAGRSIRRSTSMSYERFHDFERTIALNYLGAVKLTMGLLPGMRERGRGHVVNVSSIGVQANPPRFSAYVASKAALDAWTRVVSSEAIGDGVVFTTIHMPLVRTEMIAPTRIYDAFPAISPEEAAELVCDAIRNRPKHVSTKLGTFAEVAYALAPKLVDQVLHRAYEAFPDSAAARGDDAEAEPSREAKVLAHLMRGVYW